jgi:hypothetical protein
VTSDAAPTENAFWLIVYRHRWLSEVLCPTIATIAGVSFGTYLATAYYGFYDFLVIPLVLGLYIPFRVHSLRLAASRAAVDRALASARNESATNIQVATTKLLEALLIGVAFPRPWRQIDLRIYCHWAGATLLYPVAWAGAHSELDVHDPIPYDTDEAVQSFAIAEACAKGVFVVRDMIVRSHLEDAMGIPLYRCVIAAPIRRGRRTLGTISVGTARSAHQAHLDGVEARDMIVTLANAVRDLWSGLDNALEGRFAREEPPSARS